MKCLRLAALVSFLLVIFLSFVVILGWIVWVASVWILKCLFSVIVLLIRCYFMKCLTCLLCLIDYLVVCFE